jgi:hypothetical protein
VLFAKAAQNQYKMETSYTPFGLILTTFGIRIIDIASRITQFFKPYFSERHYIKKKLVTARKLLVF